MIVAEQADQRAGGIVGKNGLVKTMASRSTKSRAKGKNRANEGGEDIHEFFVRELPPENTNQAPYFANALREAGGRYDRYAARRNDWRLYAARRKRLEKITKSAKELTVGLCELDILSRDDLASRIGPKEIEALAGSLLLLAKETTDLAKETQQDGSPRDLAFERWILELADIYENAFCKAARI